MGIIKLAIDAALVGGGLGMTTYGIINSMHDAKEFGCSLKRREKAAAPIEEKAEEAKPEVEAEEMTTDDE